MGEPVVNHKPSVFEYSDYRLFLADLYKYFKSTKPQFSYRFFSQRAGFQSPNFLKLVINGQRNLTQKSCEKFCKGLSLDNSESLFFKELVNFNQSSISKDKSHFAKNIYQILARRQVRSLKQSEMAYYAHWYNVAIREIVALEDFKEDPFWIANKFDPKLSPTEVKLSLKNLESLGLLTRDDDGRLTLGERSLNTENEVCSSLVASYHLKMLELAGQSIDRTPRTERELSALCIPASKGSFEKIKKRIQEFREEILLLAAEDTEATQVYQINMQLFPLTTKKRGNNQ